MSPKNKEKFETMTLEAKLASFEQLALTSAKMYLAGQKLRFAIVSEEQFPDDAKSMKALALAQWSDAIQPIEEERKRKAQE